MLKDYQITDVAILNKLYKMPSCNLNHQKPKENLASYVNTFIFYGSSK